MQVVPIGGRVKAAGIGLDHLPIDETDPIVCDGRIREIIARPPSELLRCFFPSDAKRIKQLLAGVGLLRPSLKTDQGMPGNFAVFEIHPTLTRSDLRRIDICGEEFLAFPEPHADLPPDIVSTVQDTFYGQNLREVASLLEGLGQRDAERGRTSFFLVRAAQLNETRIFGSDIVRRVEDATGRLIESIIAQAGDQEFADSGHRTPSNLIYVQPDAYISPEGEVEIDRLNCPDVGLFLRGLRHPTSKRLPIAASLMTKMRAAICEAILSRIPDTEITLLTRDEVIDRAEDLLELGELHELMTALRDQGKMVRVARIREIPSIPTGSAVILLNLNYAAGGIDPLFARHCSGEIRCFPNPYVQRICQRATGLTDIELTEPERGRFLQLVSSKPKNTHGHHDVMYRVHGYLAKAGLDAPIYHVAINEELVPVVAGSLHSWHQVTRRLARHEGVPRISLRPLPVRPNASLLTSETGPRMHVYRFLCTF